ncbi:MAG: hypothetical protein KA902_05860, partial [Arenimonas sp.]|nr:hypothetical protein [Arenimonas sp.]
IFIGRFFLYFYSWFWRHHDARDWLDVIVGRETCCFFAAFKASGLSERRLIVKHIQSPISDDY